MHERQHPDFQRQGVHVTGAVDTRDDKGYGSRDRHEADHSQGDGRELHCRECSRGSSYFEYSFLDWLQLFDEHC